LRDATRRDNDDDDDNNDDDDDTGDDDGGDDGKFTRARGASLLNTSLFSDRSAMQEVAGTASGSCATSSCLREPVNQ